MESGAKTPEQIAYVEREKRINDAIALKKPDRIPITSMFSFFPAYYAGFTIREVMYDPEKMLTAWVKTFNDFTPDLLENPFPLRGFGRLLEILDCRMLKWAGHGLDDNATYQFVEEEYMTADEYDEFLYDMTDFMMHKFWPRVFGICEPLKTFPHLHDIMSYYFGLYMTPALFTPEMQAFGAKLKEAAKESERILSYAAKYGKIITEAGFPANYGGFSQVPFDTLGDFFRGTKGLMLDMYRRPEKVLAAVDKLLPIMIRIGVTSAKRSGNPRIFIPLHKGVENFMSDAQYEKFYWPGFKALMEALIDEGLIPCPLVEGRYNSRLKYLAQVPAGKVCYHFEVLDYPLARKHLEGIACFRGGMPVRLLATGTPDDVNDHMKKFMDMVGEDYSGFIFEGSTSFDDAKPENVRAMYDFILK
jgi:uroporphyrinogen-III decarboxylase